MAAKGLLRALGEELRDRRQSKGLSQERLAERANVHSNYIGLLKRGQRNPTILSLESVATALKARASELLMSVEERLR